MRKTPSIAQLVFLAFLTGCSVIGGAGLEVSQPAVFAPAAPSALPPPAASAYPAEAGLPTAEVPSENPPAQPPTSEVITVSTLPPAPAETQAGFAVGEEITIQYLGELAITGSQITFEEQLPQASNYQQHLVSYLSEGYKIYGLLTIPVGEPPAGGFKAIVFNHGYIPPSSYRTLERYTAYVDALARSGFVVFKIDYRGHGLSEGEASGSYFSPGYAIDAISALKSLQTHNFVDPQGIGMWGHSMAGNLVLRAMLVEPDIQAGVVWAGAVYSYEDFVKYGIEDSTYRPPENTAIPGRSVSQRRSRQLFDLYGPPDAQSDYWKAVSLTENIEYLTRPLQLHHAQDDDVVNIGYSLDLAAVLQENGKAYEIYTYPGGGHNLVSPYFEQAMLRTVEFFRNNL